MFDKLWKKLKPNMLIINQFIIKYKLHGMVTWHSQCRVPWRSITSLFFNVILNTWIYTFSIFKYTEVKGLLNNLFHINVKSDNLLSEIYNVIQKRELTNHFSWLIAMLVGFKHIYVVLLCVSLCAKKQVTCIWTYFIFLYFYHGLSKTILNFCQRFWRIKELRIFTVIIDPSRMSF